MTVPYPDLVNIFSGHTEKGGECGKDFCEKFNVCRSDFSRMINGKANHCQGWMLKSKFLGLDANGIELIKHPNKGRNKGIPQSESAKYKNRMSHLGKHASKETLEKMRLSQIGKHNDSSKYYTAEVRLKMSLAKAGKPWTEARRSAQNAKNISHATI